MTKVSALFIGGNGIISSSVSKLAVERGFDLVAALFGLDFGETNAATRVIYGLVGLAAVYGIASLAGVRRRTTVSRPGPVSASR